MLLTPAIVMYSTIERKIIRFASGGLHLQSALSSVNGDGGRCLLRYTFSRFPLISTEDG